MLCNLAGRGGFNIRIGLDVVKITNGLRPRYIHIYTCKLWNELPSEVFSPSYKISRFKENDNTYSQGRHRINDAPGVVGVYK